MSLPQVTAWVQSGVLVVIEWTVHEAYQASEGWSAWLAQWTRLSRRAGLSGLLARWTVHEAVQASEGWSAWLARWTVHEAVQASEGWSAWLARPRRPRRVHTHAQQRGGGPRPQLQPSLSRWAEAAQQLQGSC
eukprot:366415-Chlamydomonas_euryale.AAC.3